MSAENLVRFIKRLLQLPFNFYRDVRFGGKHLGIYKLPPHDPEEDYYRVENSPYKALERVFAGVEIRDDDLLVDVGCGPGRVINFWLSKNRRAKMVGLEMNPEVGQATGERLRKYPNVEIIIGDAVENLPPETTLIYLYNPFKAKHVRRLADKAGRLERRQELRIVYYDAEHLEVFKAMECWSIETFTVGPDLSAHIRYRTRPRDH